MPSIRVKKYLNNGTYFLTFTIKDWMYILDRQNRWDLISTSIQFFINNRGLRLYSFVFMINHIHLIINSSDTAGFIRDFKKYTAYKIMESIKKYEPDLVIKFSKLKGGYQVWEKTNMPKYIETEKYFLQKKQYIENNPVKKDYVILPEYWYWSSANEACELGVEDYW